MLRIKTRVSLGILPAIFLLAPAIIAAGWWQIPLPWTAAMLSTVGCFLAFLWGDCHRRQLKRMQADRDYYWIRYADAMAELEPEENRVLPARHMMRKPNYTIPIQD